MASPSITKARALERKLARQLHESKTREFSRYKDDPVSYAAEVLEVQWWGKQIQIAQALKAHSRVVVQAAFGVGKTHVSAGLGNWYYDTFSSSTVVITASVYRQVERLFQEIRAQRRTLPIALKMSIKDPKDPLHVMFGASVSQPQNMQGIHRPNLLVIMDEAALIENEIWESVERDAVAANNKVLAIGNPLSSGHRFYEVCRPGSGWHHIHISALEHPNIVAALAGRPEPYEGAVSVSHIDGILERPFVAEFMGKPYDDEELNAWKNDGAFEWYPGSGDWWIPGARAQIEILGEFPTEREGAIWSTSWLEAAREREVLWQEGDPVEVGLDVAELGGDAAAVHIRRGSCSLFHQSWRKHRIPATAGRAYRIILDALSEHGDAPYVVIRIGRSGWDAGVYGILEEHFGKHSDIQLVEVPEGGNALDSRNFADKRSELWYTAADYGRTGELDLTRIDERSYRDLFDQLLAAEGTVDSRGRTAVEQKKKTAAKLGRSPDDADAFNMAYAGEGLRSPWSRKDDDLKQPSRWLTERTVAATRKTEDDDAPLDWGIAQKSRWKGRFGR